MATLWVREYKNLALDASGQPLQIPLEGDSVRDQTVSFTTTTQSNAFRSDTKYVAISSSVAFHYKVGANPTATPSSARVAADQWIFFGLDRQDLKVAAVTAS